MKNPTGNRRVIVPPGVIENVDEVNVIEVPKNLQNLDVPLIVIPGRRGLNARALPAFTDQLSGPAHDSQPSFIGTELICTVEQRQQQRLAQKGESIAPNIEMNIPQETGSEPEEYPEEQYNQTKPINAKYKKLCSGSTLTGPRIMYVSSKSTKQVGDDIPDTRQIEINIPEGIDEKTFLKVYQGESGPC